MISLFPKDDYAQTVRIKRFLMAFTSYFIWGFLAVLTYLLGISTAPFYVLVSCLSGILIGNLAIYVILRTGLNKRFNDPSLTLLQMLVATFWAMVILYYADAARGSVLLLYLVVFVFGLFKLKVREFLFLSLFAVANYAAVIFVLYQSNPESISYKTDILNIVVLATVLPWFSLVGGYIANLRNKLSSTLSSVKETELKFRTIFDSASDGIILLNLEEGKFSSANVKISGMLGYENGGLLGLGIHDIHPPESFPFVLEQFNKLLKQEILFAKNIPVMRKDKTVFFADITASPITLDKKRYVIGMFRDISERKRDEDLLRMSRQVYQELSIIDDLTKLFNSRHFYERLEKEIERSNRYAEPLTLLLLDLDRFKKFNDTYGHVEGDLVLSQLGEVIKRCLRETDSAYRYGGEEFTIMLPVTTGEHGILIAERIRAEFSNEVFPDKEVAVTMSIGLSQHRPGESAKEFVHRVDKLMYQAKKDGGDRINHG